MSQITQNVPALCQDNKRQRSNDAANVFTQTIVDRRAEKIFAVAGLQAVSEPTAVSIFDEQMFCIAIVKIVNGKYWLKGDCYASEFEAGLTLLPPAVVREASATVDRLCMAAASSFN
jgi:hypothetical protein